MTKLITDNKLLLLLSLLLLLCSRNFCMLCVIIVYDKARERNPLTTDSENP